MSLFLVLFLLHAPLSAEPTIFLTQAERDWLLQLKQPLKLGITKIPNQVLPKAEGGYEGFAIDLFQRIKKQLDIKIEYIYFDSWNELLKAGMQKEVDMVFLMQKTSNRLHYFYFTDTVLSQKNKIIVHEQNCQFDLKKSSGHQIAISQGSAIEEFLHYYYPELKLVPVNSEMEALALVDAGKAEATIAGAVRASYYIQEQNFNHLCIADDLGYDYYLAIASRNDWPILNIVLSKAINHIKPSEMEALRFKWGYIDAIRPKNKTWDQNQLLHIAIAIGVFILPLLIYLYFRHQLKQMEKIYLKTLKELKAAKATIRHLKNRR